MNDIPAQWQSFAPHMGRIPGQVGSANYGLSWNRDGSMDYLSGVEVSSASGLPSEFSVVAIPAQRYVVFGHRGHVSKLYETCEAIPGWFAGSGYEGGATRGTGETPDFFERYTEEFDPRSGIDGMEVWVPLKS